MAHVNLTMRTAVHAMPLSRLIARKSAPSAASANASNILNATGATPPAANRDAAADFRALFTSRSSAPVPATDPAPTPSTAAPTAQSLFGPNPWMSNPGGVAPNGVTYSYNPYYFATAETAAKVAQMVGGTVVQANALTPYGPFQQNQQNYMVQLPNGRQINAGLFASFFDHGYTKDLADRMVTAELTDAPA